MVRNTTIPLEGIFKCLVTSMKGVPMRKHRLQYATYLHVSIWKHVLRKEQSPSVSSVCFWMIFLKCNFLQVPWHTLAHSARVPCGQNSITCAPPWDLNLSARDFSLAVGWVNKAKISSPNFLFSFSLVDGIDNKDWKQNKNTLITTSNKFQNTFQIF